MGNWQGSSVNIENCDLGSIKLKKLDGEECTLKNYIGKVLLITNVASKCGLTKQNLTEFKILYDKYKDEGLEILAFPCSQFGGQEYKTSIETKNFMDKYEINFPLFEMINVNGPNTHPIFQYLKYHSDELGCDSGKCSAIGWNYGKFLVDRNGKVVKYYSPKTNPSYFEEDIKKVLQNELQGK